MTLKPVIGIIGGIGSGKSTVAAALARRGGRVIAGDPAGHEALRQPDIKATIAARWPDSLLGVGEIDRKSLGRMVFSDPGQLKQLEAIVFPWIKARLTNEIASAQADPTARFIVLDAAVMLEAGWNDVCDWMLFVDAAEQVRAARVANRGWSIDELRKREASQLSLSEKRKRADAVIENNGSPDELLPKVDAILARWGLSPEPA